jgi:hypothetical protein
MRVTGKPRSIGMLCGALLLAASCSRGGSDYEPIVDLKEFMNSVIEPASEDIFDAAVWVNGELVGAPQSEEDWAHLRGHAIALAEVASLLKLPQRAKDQAGWIVRTQAMIDAAIAARQAAEAKNQDGVFQAGNALYSSCEACHQLYAPNIR